jgi:hypothetical protein
MRSEVGWFVADPKSKSFPLLNKGINLKTDPGLLGDGQFYQLINLTSILEGSLTARLGSQKFPNSAGIGVIGSLAKLSLTNGSDSTNPRYVGDGTNIYRVTGPYSSTSGNVSLVNTQGQWEATPFDADASGTPLMYFASKGRMMRDNGAYSPLHPWGYLPPVQPVTATPAGPSTVVLDDLSADTSRLVVAITSATLITPGYYNIIPASMAGILPGMLIQVSSNPGLDCIIDQVSNTGFNAFTESAPSGTVEAWFQPVDKDSSGGSVTQLTANGGFFYHEFTPGSPVDWSLTGTAIDGYSSDDVVHFGLYIGNGSYISQIRARCYCNGSTGDYYEKVVTPSQIQAFVEGNETALSAGQALATLVTQGLTPGTSFPSDLLNQVQTVGFPALLNATWFEFEIPKSDFIANGNAGNGPQSWKNISTFEIEVDTNSITGLPTFDVWVGAIYAHGGYGLDSVSIPSSTNYDWIYTFRNPVTLEESNPCTAMVSTALFPILRRAANVTCYGTDTSSSGQPDITGTGSIAIYRRGGTFSDGFYRLVGYAANPGVTGGVPNAVTFIDGSSDSDIAAALTNNPSFDPPVTSSPLSALNGTIATISGGGAAGQYVTVTISPYSSTTLVGYVTPGSQVTVGTGETQEECIVLSMTISTLTFYIQNSHSNGESIFCEELVGTPCDIICPAGDSLLLAGDPNQPHVVYMSLPGRPHAFPVVDQITNISYNLHVSAPGNPINGLVNYGGEYVALCLSGIFVFQIWQGQMLQAVKTSADHGLIQKHLWWLVAGEIWYLSDDGIYAWAGGGCRKVTGDVDWIFRGQTVGGYSPIDYTSLYLCGGAYYQGYFWFAYRDTTGASRLLRYALAEKRWEVPSVASFGAITAFLREPDTNRLIAGAYIGGSGQLLQMEIGTTDQWTGSPTGGNSIPFQANTAFMSPEGRLEQILLQDIVIEAQNPNDIITVQMFYDFSATGDGTDIFQIATGATRRRISFPVQQSGLSPNTTAGKECYAFSLQFTGSSVGALQIFSIGCRYTPLTQIQRGITADWSDIGQKFDKRFYEVTIEFNTFGVGGVNYYLDTISGIDGNTYTAAVQTIALPAVSGRSKKTFAIVDGVIAKLVRLRSQVQTLDIEIFNVSWVKEDYPADIVNFTEYTDKGYAWDKYFQQIVLDVNTNGVAIPVQIEADGVVKQTVSVTSTLDTRNQILTLNPAIKAKKARILLGTFPSGGMFQLWNCDFVTQPADKGAVSHTYDFDDLGHPWDKHLRSFTIEYDNGGNGPITLNIDTLTGIGGGTVNAAALTYSLSASGRGKQTFAVPDGNTVKMVRLYPASDNVNYKQWTYSFDFDKYPADSIAWTPWEDGGYKHLKIIQELAFDVDTGGVAATVILQVDGSSNTQTFTVNTTSATRDFIYTLNPEITGMKFRILVTPGTNGKFQLFSLEPHFVKGDPGPVEHSFDWDDLQSPYPKLIQVISVEYDTGGASVTMVMDTISGVEGNIQNLAVESFTLSGAGRSKQSFSVAIDTIVTMIRIRPTSTFGTLKAWKYTVQKVVYPPPIIAATLWDDVGSPWEKVLRAIEIQIDTGGVACSLQLQVDGSNEGSPWSVTTTSTDRAVILTPQSNIIGKLFRIVPTPGSGGQAQIFGVVYQCWNEPPYLTHWDSYEVTLGYLGWKLIKQVWSEYYSTVGITVSFYTDNGVLFFQQALPPHPQRDIERFFLPDVNNGVTNKSKRVRVMVDSQDGVTPFKLYADASRLEVMNLSGDQRACYGQFQFSELTQPKVN